MQKAILDAKKAAEKQRDENTDASARHIFREFLPASILNKNGFALEYEKPIGREGDVVQLIQKPLHEGKNGVKDIACRPAAGGIKGILDSRVRSRSKRNARRRLSLE